MTRTMSASSPKPRPVVLAQRLSAPLALGLALAASLAWADDDAPRTVVDAGLPAAADVGAPGEADAGPAETTDVGAPTAADAGLPATVAFAVDAGQPEAPAPAEEKDPGELRRTCQVCRHGTLGFKFVLPIFLPISAFSGESDDAGSGGTPQLVQFDTGVRFGFLGQLSLRLGDFTTELNVAGIGLGTHPVVSLQDKSLELGSINLSLLRGAASFKWNAAPLEFGQKERPLRLAFWPYAGARVLALFGSANLAQEQLALDGSTVWGEPLLGLETILDPPNGWTLRLLTEVGGFGLGSDFSARAELRVEFHFLSWLSARLGWEFFYLLSTPDRQVDRIEIFAYGPVLGLELGY